MVAAVQVILLWKDNKEFCQVQFYASTELSSRKRILKICPQTMMFYLGCKSVVVLERVKVALDEGSVDNVAKSFFLSDADHVKLVPDRCRCSIIVERLEPVCSSSVVLDTVRRGLPIVVTTNLAHPDLVSKTTAMSP